jgi:hypothetical protein
MGVGGKLQFKMYRIERNEDLIEAVEKRAREFWKCVVDGVEPPDFKIEPGFAAKLPRVAGKVAQVPADSAKQFMDAKERLAEIEAEAREQKKVVELRKALVLTHMGDAEIGDCPYGRFSLKEIIVKGYTVEGRTDKRFSFKAAKSDE